MKKFGLILSTLICLQMSYAQTPAPAPNNFNKIYPKSERIVAYKNPHTYDKTAAVGNYPKIKNAKPWDGRIAGAYSIKFIIKGLKEGETVLLADHHIGGKYLRDTAVVNKKGVAEFKGNKLLQRGMYLFVLPEKADFFEFLIDDDQDFTIKTDTSFYAHDYYKNMKVEGSDENTWFVGYQNQKTAIIEEIIEIDATIKKDSTEETIALFTPRRNALLQEKMDADSLFVAQHPSSMLSRFLLALMPIDVPEPPKDENGLIDSSWRYRYFKTHYWENVDFNEEALVRMPVNVLKTKLDYYFDNVIIPDADSSIEACNDILRQAQYGLENEKYLIWYLTNRFESSKIMGLDRVFVHMALSQYCAGRTWWVDSTTTSNMCNNAYRRSYSLIGAQAADLQLKNQDSVWIKTNSIKAPYTILMFWDPTCGHCKEIMPKIAKIYEENKAKGWKVITLAAGNNKKEWYEYLAAHPEISEFTNLLRGEVLDQRYAEALQAYYVISSPTIFLLDENKKIVANRIDVEKIVEYIAHLESKKAR